MLPIIRVRRHARAFIVVIDSSSDSASDTEDRSAAASPLPPALPPPPAPMTPPFVDLAVASPPRKRKRSPSPPPRSAFEFRSADARRALQQRFTPDSNRRNAHPRDTRVRTDFSAERHDYYVDGVLATAADGWYSPSGLMKFLWKAFDADSVAARLAQSSRNPRYAGRSAQEIKALWEQGRLDGQAAHAAEDAWLQHAPLPDGSEPPLGFFRAMAELAERGYDVFRTEMTMFDEELRLKGQSDLLLIDRATGRITVADHKHCRVESLLREEAHGGGGGIHPWSEAQQVPDSRKGHYHFQLSLYHLILKRKYAEWPLSDDIVLINYSPLGTDAGAYEIVTLPVIDLTATGFLRYLPWDPSAPVHQEFLVPPGAPPLLLPRAPPGADDNSGPTRRMRLPAPSEGALRSDMVWIGRAYAKRGLPESVWAHPWRWYPTAPWTAAGYYERYLLQNRGLLARLGELVGKTLLCWCRPPQERCACAVLVQYANLLAAGRITLPPAVEPDGRMWAALLGPKKPAGE